MWADRLGTPDPFSDSHYHKKIAIPKFQINEVMIMETSKNPLCKSRFKELSAA